MKTRLQQAKKNHKGFTLVELIIVVAIIAVLAAVLAPQYLQYVERSRESDDLQVATIIMRAATAAVADPQNEVPGGADFTITWETETDDGDDVTFDVTGSTAAANEAVYAAICDIMGWVSGRVSGEPTVATGNVAEDAKSANGNLADFVFTISADTGTILLDETGTAGDTTADRWGAGGIGVNP